MKKLHALGQILVIFDHNRWPQDQIENLDSDTIGKDDMPDFK